MAVNLHTAEHSGKTIRQYLFCLARNKAFSYIRQKIRIKLPSLLNLGKSVTQWKHYKILQSRVAMDFLTSIHSRITQLEYITPDQRFLYWKQH